MAVRNAVVRRWMLQLIVLALSLALVTGFAVTASLRIRRKVNGTLAGWRSEPLVIAHRVMMMSTSDEAIKAIRERHPNWVVGKCISPAGHPRIEWPRHVNFVVVRGGRVNRGVIRRADRDRIPVFAGIGGNYEQGRQCLRIGAGGILGASARSVQQLSERFSGDSPDAHGSMDSWRYRPVWRDR